MIWLCVKRTSNVRKDRTSESRKTLDDFFVQVRNFLLPLSLNVLRHKEREAQSFYSAFFICPPPNTCGTRQKDLREQAKTNRLPPRQVSSQLTDFFKISQNPPRSSGAWRHPHSVIPLSMWANMTSLSDSSAHARAWTPVLMFHLSNPCPEPKGSQPN